MLKLLKKYNIKCSWFIPGHSLDTFVRFSEDKGKLN